MNVCVCGGGSQQKPEEGVGSFVPIGLEDCEKSDVGAGKQTPLLSITSTSNHRTTSLVL